MEWKDIERIGRENYNLSSEWYLCAADASDSNVMKIEFSKKGSRGGWLKGNENRFNGYIANYKQLPESVITNENHNIEEQLSLF